MSKVKKTVLHEIMLPGEIYRFLPHLCGAFATLILLIVSFTSWLGTPTIPVICALILLIYAIVVLVARSLIYSGM